MLALRVIRVPARFALKDKGSSEHCSFSPTNDRVRILGANP